MFNPFSLFSSPPKMAKVPAPDRNEIATIGRDRDWTRGFIAPNQPLPPQDSILQSKTYNGIGGYDLFRDLLTDWTVFSALQQRRLALVSAETEIIPGGQKRADKNAAAFLEEALQHIGWDKISAGMHYGIYYGFGVGECLWGRDGATVTLDAVRIRDRRRFCFDGEQRLRLMTTQNGYPGERLPDRKFWSFQTGADHDDEPYGMGLAHWLYWPVSFKRGGIKFWVMSAEKFGSPSMAGWFPLGASEQDRAKLLASLKAIQVDAAIILPDGARAELLESKRSAGGDYAVLCQYMDAAINKIILSQMAPADSTASKLNVSAEEPKTWQRLVKADADLICESFNHGPARWLTEWNFPGAALPRVYRRTEPPNYIAQRSEIERRIFDMGYRPTLKQIEEEYDGEWEAVPSPAPVAPAADTAPPEFADMPASKFTPTQQEIEDLGAAALKAAPAAPLDPDRLLDAIYGARDEADLRDRLLAIWEDGPDAAFTDALGKAQFMAQIIGYVSAEERRA